MASFAETRSGGESSKNSKNLLILAALVASLAAGTAAIVLSDKDTAPQPGDQIGQNGLPFGKTTAEKGCQQDGPGIYCNMCRWKEAKKCPGGEPEHSTDPYHPGSN